MTLRTYYLSIVCIFFVLVRSQDLIPFINEPLPILGKIPRIGNATGTARSKALRTALPSSSNCGGCSFVFEALDVPWTTPMRTLLVLIDDSTNLTSTSTVPFSTYETDVSVGIKQFIDAGTVQLEKKLHLTYPTLYEIFQGFQKQTIFPEYTTILNGMSANSSPLCRSTQINYTTVFAVPLVNEFDEKPGSALSDLESFLSTMTITCTPYVDTHLIPMMKAPASALTITRTSLTSLARSANANPSPSAKAQNPVALATTRVHSQNDIQSPHSDNPSPKIIPSQPAQPASNPPPLTNPSPVKLKYFAQSMPTLHGQPESISPINTQSNSDLPLEHPAARPVITVGSRPVTSKPLLQFDINGKTSSPGGSAIKLDGTPMSLAPFASHVVIGDSTSLLAPLQPSSLLDITLDGRIITANSLSQFVIDQQTLQPGDPGIIVSGTLLSLGPSAAHVVIAGNTFKLASDIVMGGTTTPPIGSATPLPPLAIDGTTIFPNSASEYLINSQTLIPGASAVTISGMRISIAPSASALILGSKTVPLTPGPTITNALPLITIGNSMITPNAASQYVIAGQTLVPGGPAIIVSGTRISLSPQATDVVLGTSTEGLRRLILDDIGATVPASVNKSVSTTGPALFQGAATRLYGQRWNAAILIFGWCLWS